MTRRHDFYAQRGIVAGKRAGISARTKFNTTHRERV